MKQLQVLKRQFSSSRFSRPYASNNYEYRGFLAGKFEGVISAPLNIVWARTHDFMDISWKTDDFELEKKDKNKRRLTYINMKVDEKLLEEFQSKELCYHIYDVKVRSANEAAQERFFKTLDFVTNTSQFRAIDADRTLFQFFSYVDGPQNSVKYYYKDICYQFEKAFKNLQATYSKTEVSLAEIFQASADRKLEQQYIAMEHPEHYEYERSLMKQLEDLVYDSVHSTRAPVGMINYPPIFPAMAGAKMADQIPSHNDILKPKKVINLLSGYVQPTFDAYANLLASDSSFYAAARNSDPWLNFDFFIHGLEASPYRVNEEVVAKLKKHPDEIYADYYFNGGNPHHIHRPLQLGTINYWKDFAEDAYVGQQIKDILKVNKLDKTTNLQGKIYVADYTIYEKYEYPNAYKGMYCHGSVVLFGEKDGKVLPLGIRFNVPKVINSKGEWDYHEENGKYISHRIFNPETTPKNIWKLAKMHTGACDLIFYQFVYHLGNGHLQSEVLSAGGHNHFRVGKNKNHKLAQIMHAPVEGLIGINHFGAIALIDPHHALTEQTFSVGAANCIDIFGRNAEENYKFEHMSPDMELAKRGFLKANPNLSSPPPFDMLGEIKKARAGKSSLVKITKYSDYLARVNADPFTVQMAGKEGLLDKELIEDSLGYNYRLDSLWLYQLIYRHVQEIVSLIYPDDRAVGQDQDLQDYGDFLRENLMKFDAKFDSVEDVVHHVATLWWVCTGFHAPSFGVEDYETYPPFRPSHLNKPMPLYDAQKDIGDEELDLALPFPRKNLLVKILIQGVTDRTGTPSLAEESIVKDVAKQLYFKQAWSYLEEHGLYTKADLIETGLYKNEQEARVHFDKEIECYVTCLELIAMLYTELRGIRAENSKRPQQEKTLFERIQELFKKLKGKEAKYPENEQEILDQIEDLKALARSEIERIPKHFEEFLTKKVELYPDEDTQARLMQQVTELIEDMEAYLENSFDIFERTGLYQAKYFKFYEEMLLLSSNVNLRNYHVPENKLKFTYLDPKLVPSSLST